MFWMRFPYCITKCLETLPLAEHLHTLTNHFRYTATVDPRIKKHILQNNKAKQNKLSADLEISGNVTLQNQWDQLTIIRGYLTLIGTCRMELPNLHSHF